MSDFFKALEKLKRQLAEADAALEARKKPPEESGPKIIGEGLVIDEWVRAYPCLLLLYKSTNILNVMNITLNDTSTLWFFRKNGGKDIWQNSKLKG